MNNLVANLFFLSALNLSDRESISALDTKIKIQMQLGEFSEALEILYEWRMLIDPEVRLKLILSNN